MMMPQHRLGVAHNSRDQRSQVDAHPRARAFGLRVWGQLAGGIGVAASVGRAVRKGGLLRTAQTGVGDDPVEQVTFGVREVFQQESVPFRERADSFLLSVELGAK
jgi:hypothetical protein